MSAPPDVPRFHHHQEVFHLTDDVPGRILALVQYADCLRYKVVWQGRVTEEHAADAEAMNTVGASMCGLVGAESVNTPPEVNNGQSVDRG